jgi:squalene synthase HpnC
MQSAHGYCRAVAVGHYENFAVVSRLLPKELHQHFYNVYAFCRWSDDLGDEVEERELSLELLNWWRNELAKCYAGESWHPVFVALRETITEFDIPGEPFENLISAFEQDQVKTEYQSLAELKDYCRRSADPVGRIVLYLFRQATPENFELSDHVCTGLQLANFWQDVARDYDIGRVYLPKQDREKFGYTDAMLKQKRSTPEFQELLKHEVDIARQFLRAGQPLVDRLPVEYQIDIDLFVRGGLCILDRIEKLDFRTWEKRPKVTKLDLLKIFFSAWRRKRKSRRGKAEPYPLIEAPNVNEEVPA